MLRSLFPAIFAALAVVSAALVPAAGAQDRQVPSSMGQLATVVCAGGQARRAGGGQRLRQPCRREQQSVHGRSVLPPVLRRRHAARAGRALARLGRARRSVGPRRHQLSRDRGRQRSEGRARPTSANSTPRSCSRISAAILRCCASRARKERFPTLEFADSDALQVGDVVLAIGDPFGVGQTVTHGIVSAVARTQVGISDYQFFIQTDAAINPGNSGGALVDINGRLVGINSAIYSRSGGSQGIGFAIPANMVRVVVASAQQRRHRGEAAVARRQASGGHAGDRRQPRSARGRPVRWSQTSRPDGPAARAGIKTGDLIVSVDGTPVDDPNAFDYRFATKPLGGAAQVGLVRQGKADDRCRSRCESLPDSAARSGRNPRPLAVPRRHGRQSFAGSGRRTAARYRRPRASSSPTWPKARRRNRSASRRATSWSPSTIRRSASPPISIASPAPAAGNGGSPSCAAASRYR